MSNKRVKSDGTGSSAPEQYCFDSKQIDAYINQKLDEIFSELEFDADRYQIGQDNSASAKKEEYKQSPRSQVRSSAHTDIYYNKWKVEW